MHNPLGKTLATVALLICVAGLSWGAPALPESTPAPAMRAAPVGNSSPLGLRTQFIKRGTENLLTGSAKIGSGTYRYDFLLPAPSETKAATAMEHSSALVRWPDQLLVDGSLPTMSHAVRSASYNFGPVQVALYNYDSASPEVSIARTLVWDTGYLAEFCRAVSSATRTFARSWREHGKMDADRVCPPGMFALVNKYLAGQGTCNKNMSVRWHLVDASPEALNLTVLPQTDVDFQIFHAPDEPENGRWTFGVSYHGQRFRLVSFLDKEAVGGPLEKSAESRLPGKGLKVAPSAWRSFTAGESDGLGFRVGDYQHNVMRVYSPYQMTWPNVVVQGELAGRGGDGNGLYWYLIDGTSLGDQEFQLISSATTTLFLQLKNNDLFELKSYGNIETNLSFHGPTNGLQILEYRYADTGWQPVESNKFDFPLQPKDTIQFKLGIPLPATPVRQPHVPIKLAPR